MSSEAALPIASRRPFATVNRKIFRQAINEYAAVVHCGRSVSSVWSVSNSLGQSVLDTDHADDTEFVVGAMTHRPGPGADSLPMQTRVTPQAVVATTITEVVNL